MSNSSKKECLQEIRERYFSVSKAKKSLILDEFCRVCNYNRKYAVRLISKKQQKHNRRKGKPKKYYGTTIIAFLKDIWVLTNLACSKRLKAAILLWLPYYHLHNSNHLIEKDVKLSDEFDTNKLGLQWQWHANP